MADHKQSQSADAEASRVSMLQIISFRVGEEEYGVEISSVQEIKGWSPATRLPNAPPHMRGVINLRGIMVPIYDLRARFGGGETEITKSHVVIIVKIRESTFGVLVDGVSDILTVNPEEIKPTPQINGASDNSYLQGLITIKDRVVALIAVDLLLNPAQSEEFKAVTGASFAPMLENAHAPAEIQAQ